MHCRQRLFTKISQKSQVISKLKCKDPSFEPQVINPGNFSCAYRNFCNISRFQPEVSHSKKDNRGYPL